MCDVGVPFRRARARSKLPAVSRDCFLRGMMRASSPGAIVMSTAFHAAVAAAVVAAGWWTMRGREIPAPLGPFVVVAKGDLEMPGLRSTRDGQTTKEPVIGFQAPKIDRVPIPAAWPLAEPVGGPAVSPKPAPKTPLASQPKTGPKTERPANGKVLPSSNTTAAAGIPQVDATAIVAALTDAASESSSDRGNAEGSSADAAAYFERLNLALRAAHEMPGAVDALFVTRISFLLGGDGSLLDVKVLKTSGNADYDRSVVAAFHRVRSIGKPPAGCSGRREINFVMTE